MNQLILLSRDVLDQLIESLVPNRVVVLLGPRRVGKTVLINQVRHRIQELATVLNGEDFAVQELFERRSVANLRDLLDGKLLLIIDEAQKISGVGEALKLMVDEIPGLRVLITGSSAFDVQNNPGEPLTGRKTTLHLFPLSEREYDQVEAPIDRVDGLRRRLVFGNYPELLQHATPVAQRRYLRELVNAYLLKDILTFEGIRNSNKMLDLLRLLAFQGGGYRLRE